VKPSLPIVPRAVLSARLRQPVHGPVVRDHPRAAATVPHIDAWLKCRGGRRDRRRRRGNASITKAFSGYISVRMGKRRPPILIGSGMRATMCYWSSSPIGPIDNPFSVKASGISMAAAALQWGRTRSSARTFREYPLRWQSSASYPLNSRLGPRSANVGAAAQGASPTPTAGRQRSDLGRIILAAKLRRMFLMCSRLAQFSEHPMR
jgi:hypothetical protein